MNAPPTLPKSDSDSHEWWEATREGRLVLQRCLNCGRFQHYPRPFCLTCYGTDLVFVESSGQGKVYSFSVVHRSPDRDVFETPYVVALVRLTEGPVLFTAIIESAPEDLKCEQSVGVAWRPLPDGRQLPVFRPLGKHV